MKHQNNLYHFLEFKKIINIAFEPNGVIVPQPLQFRFFHYWSVDRCETIDKTGEVFAGWSSTVGTTCRWQLKSSNNKPYERGFYDISSFMKTFFILYFFEKIPKVDKCSSHSWSL